MDKLLVKLRQAVALRQSERVVIKDVRSRSMTFGTYRWVLLSVVVVGFYYAFVASDRYVSEARVYVKSTNTGVSSLPQLQLLPGGQGSAEDANLVTAYLNSRDVMYKLDKDVGLIKHYSESGADVFSRLSPSASSEKKLSYFKKHLSVSTNIDNGILVIKGQGFTPEFAHKLVEAAVKAGEEFVNGVGQKLAKEEIAFVEQELARASDNLKTARNNLLAFQNENGLLSAEAVGVTMQGIVSELEAQLVRLQTEEKALGSYLNDSASDLVTIRAKIAAIKNQLKAERQKMASQDGVSINDVYAEYKELELELKFATDIYQAALIALEKARVDSYHKLKHLVVVQSPAVPESAQYPRKLYNLMTLFVALSLFYGIVTMILATIREHRDV